MSYGDCRCEVGVNFRFVRTFLRERCRRFPNGTKRVSIGDIGRSGRGNLIAMTEVVISDVKVMLDTIFLEARIEYFKSFLIFRVSNNHDGDSSAGEAVDVTVFRIDVEPTKSSKSNKTNSPGLTIVESFEWNFVQTVLIVPGWEMIMHEYGVIICDVPHLERSLLPDKIKERAAHLKRQYESRFFSISNDAIQVNEVTPGPTFYYGKRNGNNSTYRGRGRGRSHFQPYARLHAQLLFRSTDPTPPNHIYWDTVGSIHATGIKEALHDWEELPECDIQYLQLANDQLLAFTHKGSLKITSVLTCSDCA